MGGGVALVRRLLTRKPRTPIPPKPYVDISLGVRAVNDVRVMDVNKLDNFHPDTQHWQANQYKARASTPFFDWLGFNQDWSWTMYKLSMLSIVVFIYYEARSVVYNDATKMRLTGSGVVPARPSYATNVTEAVVAQAKSLRDAGITFVGVKQLDRIDTDVPTSNTTTQTTTTTTTRST